MTPQWANYCGKNHPKQVKVVNVQCSANTAAKVFTCACDCCTVWITAKIKDCLDNKMVTKKCSFRITLANQGLVKASNWVKIKMVHYPRRQRTSAGEEACIG